MAVVAQGIVELIPSARGFSSKLNSEIAGGVADVGDKQGKSLGSRMAGAMGAALKTAAKTGAIAAGVAAGAAVVGGFKSAIQQENTEKTLSGLYGSASKATDMMGKLKAISKNSPIEYSAYGKAAESLAYAGVEGNKASTILDKVGMAIVGAGGGSEELQRAMDGILKGVNNGGIVMNDTLGMISESGFPIINALQEKFGVTGDVIKKMAAEGEISIDDVLEVMEKGTGDLAQAQAKAGKEVSKTFGNQWKIAKDRVVTAIGSGMRPALASLAPLIGKAGSAVAGFVEDFSAGTGAAGKFRDVLARLGGYIGSGFKAAFSAVSPYFKQFGSAMASLWPAVKQTASAVGDFLVAAFQAAKPYLEAAARVLGVVLVGAMKVLPPILRVVMGAFRGLLAMLKPLLPLIAALGAAFLVYRGAVMAVSIAQRIAAGAAAAYRAIMFALYAPQAAWAAAKYAMAAAERVYSATVRGGTGAVKARTLAEKVGMIVGKAQIAVTKAMAVAQRLFNAALRANPIGLVIAALTLLGVALVIAYKKSETFRRIVNAAWAGIKKAASATVNWFKNVAWPVMKSVFQSIGKVAKWLWKNAIKPYFNFIWNLVKKVSGWIKNTGWPWIRKAFNAIGGRAKWLWKQIRQAFNWIWDKVKAVLGWIKNTGWKWIKKAFQGYAKIGKWLWRQMRDAWNWIRNKIRDVVSWIKNTAWKRFIKPAFDAIAGRAQWMWRKVRDVFDRFKTGVGRLRDAIGRAKDGIKRSWGRILDAIKNPIKKALGWLQRNFVTKLRNMLDKVPGVSPSIIPNIPGVSGWARGGILPGYTPMGKGDDVLTPMRSGEGVMVSEGLRDSRSRSMFLAANAAAKRGTSFADFLGGGYAGGGIVGTYSGKKAALVALGRWMQRQGYHVSEHSKFGGNNPRYHMKGSKHNTDEALDVNADPWLTKFSSEKRALDRLNRKLRANDWHTLWRVKDHFDHLHVDTGSGGRSGNPLSMLINGFKNAASWMKGKFDKLTSGFDPSKYGLAGKILPAVFKKIRGAVKSKVEGAFDALSFGDSGGNFNYGAVKGGTNRVMGKLMAAKRGWTGSQWSALNKLWERESNWNHHAKNPSSGAYGIPQSLPGSKMASVGSDWRTNPKTQIAWGLNYIAGRYGSPLSAWAHSQRTGWYAKGTLSARRGPAVVGEQGPELMWMRGGERIASHRQSKRLMASQPAAGSDALSGPVVVNVIDRDGTFVERMRGEIRDHDRFNRSVSRMGGVR